MSNDDVAAKSLVHQLPGMNNSPIEYWCDVLYTSWRQRQLLV